MSDRARLEVFDIEIYDGLTMSDLIKETHISIRQTGDDVKKFLDDIVSKVNKASDVMMVQETLSNLLDTYSKKPDHLIKLLQAVQRIVNTKIIGKSDEYVDDREPEFLITEDERKLLYSIAEDLIKIGPPPDDTNQTEPKQQEQLQLPGPNISSSVERSPTDISGSDKESGS